MPWKERHAKDERLPTHSGAKGSRDVSDPNADPDLDPRVGSAVAHVPSAGDGNGVAMHHEIATSLLAFRR
jgi:hypothetical protein